LTVLMLARADRSGMLPSSKMTCRQPPVMQEGQKSCRASARRHKPLMAFKALRLSCTLRLAPCSALQFGVGQLLTCSAMQASQSNCAAGAALHVHRRYRQQTRTSSASSQATHCVWQTLNVTPIAASIGCHVTHAC
jgi:hypothetical protein